MTRSIIRTITTAIAIAALAAPTALARPADMPPAVAKAAAAEQHKQDPPRPAPDATRRVRAQGEQANPRPEPAATAAPSAPAERDIAWTHDRPRHRRRLLAARRDRRHRQPHAPAARARITA